MAHNIVSFKNSLWKQAMNGSWHRFNPNTIVKAIHARCMGNLDLFFRTY
ncbi:hypothetical protein ACFPTR_10560 [Aliibacillus thermotolerans]|uniref:Uncharacterized protein n=1 Tax=Aliibacillus thermotolerans TaxID=1834418 RepID=A0ABW0U994_9BACI|nr:hypothetical protein [Aliibacillus thermotolerans]MDA3129571.1 hypothetical protein [Aliibacillus thermotolerans]